MLTLTTYTWRGKTYKTNAGLFRATIKAYPGTSQSFDKDAMYLRERGGIAKRFKRSFDAQHNSIIADQFDIETL